MAKQLLQIDASDLYVGMELVRVRKNTNSHVRTLKVKDIKRNAFGDPTAVLLSHGAASVWHFIGWVLNNCRYEFKEE